MEEERREGIEEEWEQMKCRIGKALEEVEKKQNIRERRGWWDEECRKMKERVRRELRKWRKEGGDKNSYRKEKGMLGGVEWRAVRGTGGKLREDGEEEISREEIGRAIKKLKEGKATGGDGIPNEVWKYGGKEVKEGLWRICRRVWKGEERPKEWREGVIVPIKKKGKGDRVEDYRGADKQKEKKDGSFILGSEGCFRLGGQRDYGEDDEGERDVDEVLRKGRWGGVRLGEEKVYTLAYVDDMALLAEDEEGMKGMIAKMERYLKEKGLEERRGEMEQGRMEMGRLVWSMVSYGVEVWGWKERKEVEKIQERYLRWVMGVERQTPGYLIREEVQRDLLKGRAGMRAWKYEKKLEEGEGGDLARECWKEMKKRAKEGRILKGWETERKEFMEEKGWKIEEVGEMKKKGQIRGGYI
ncbi:hypothetical protein X777_14227 [Ooceraea biroi]|uniref:Reverse transcriptase domain-containing protein n=1 Tax=Ooceraea biroi TaxID=2015173 RepID=A0A026VXN9_OOCBI|nr:hypothetical protein X777_14227 [Ooceraea biroi]